MRRKGVDMGQPVVHFEVIGKDSEKLRGFYSELFGWEIDADNPMNYGIVQREGNTTDDGIGIGGGVGPAQEGSDGWVTFYVQTDDVEGSLKKAESLGGTRLMGPMEVPGGPELGLFNDPEGHLIGVVKAPAG
jgi:predicted enzyme related to lactoylglutathione lyase